VLTPVLSQTERVLSTIPSISRTRWRSPRPWTRSEYLGKIIPRHSTILDHKLPRTLTAAICAGFLILGDASSVHAQSVVDPSTLENKFLFGYQGWFTSHLDGDPYSGPNKTDLHWATSGSGAMSPNNATVDFWPDTTAYPPNLLYPTGFTLPSGQTAMVYSAWNPGTVDLHFQWMQQYGIDGVVLQEFVQNYLNSPVTLQEEIDQVALNVMASAEKYGRVFSVGLDCSACTPATVVSSVETRWMHLVDDLKLTQSSAYLHHNGRPVVTVFAFGVANGANNITSGGVATATQVEELINWFHSDAPPQYQATIIGQTCVGWRTLGQGCLTDPAWTSVYNEYDVIQPWYVGAWANLADADANWNHFIKGDIDQTKANGQGYMPTLWPGTSVSNLERTIGKSYPLNQIPRLGGQFWWHQLYNYLGRDASHKITMAYGAMFDEINEGTAMYKLAPIFNDVPQEAPAGFVYLGMPDSYAPIGYHLPSDWYLELANCGTLALHGHFVPTNTIPAAGVAPGYN